MGACLGMLGVAAAGFALGGIHRAVYVRASGRALFFVSAAPCMTIAAGVAAAAGAGSGGRPGSRLDGDIAEVQRFGTDAAAAFIGSVLMLIAVGAVMLGLSWRLTLLVAALLPRSCSCVNMRGLRIEASTRALREAAARSERSWMETLSGARHVQATAARSVERRRLDAHGEDYLTRVLRQQLVTFATDRWPDSWAIWRRRHLVLAAGMCCRDASAWGR